MDDANQNPQVLSHKDFMRLFLEHEPRLYGYIRSLVPNRADAENVLQESAAVLWEKFDEFRPGSDFGRWAVTVARYQVLYFRQQQKRNVLSFSQAFIDCVDEAAAEQANQYDALHRALDDCIEKLNEADRDLLRRRYLPGAKVPAIAAELGRPVTTVYHALDHIRRELADCVERRLQAEERS